jgi:hypothetical protein
MKRSGFRQQSLEEVKEKQAIKRSKLMLKPRKAPKPRVALKNTKKVAKRSKKPKSKTQAQLKKELDTVFSQFIRQKYADKDGNVACFTCGKVMHWKQIQNGHFISRSYLATRFHEDNCRPQCVGCNVFGGGKPLDFEENLKKQLSPKYVEELKKLRHSSVKYDRHWYTERINNYKNELS